MVEADETYFGDKDVRDEAPQARRVGPASKRAVLALVERGGKVRTFHVDDAPTRTTVGKIVRENVDRESRADDRRGQPLQRGRRGVRRPRTVSHSAGEYVARTHVHTNTIEGYFGLFKRGMKGIYQHCGEKHLHRYLAEFDFRYNTPHRARR